MLSRIVILSFLLFVLVSPFKVFADSSVVLNEVLVHPNAGGKEWVEFYASDIAVVRTYWLDDDTDFASDNGNSPKKTLESVLPGNGNQHFFIDLSGAMFNNSEDVVILFKPDGSIADQIKYNDDPGYDMTFGRSPDGAGAFYLLDKSTKGNPNSGPKPTPTPTPQPTAKPANTSSDDDNAGSSRTTTRSSASPTTRTTAIPTPIITRTATPKVSSSAVKLASQGAYPTAVLGASTKAEPTRMVLPSIPVKVKGASDAPALFTILGAGFIIACAVILFIRKLRKAA